MFYIFCKDKKNSNIFQKKLCQDGRQIIVNHLDRLKNADFIGKMTYLTAIIQCSKSFALPSFPVIFLYNLLFSFDV